MNPISSETKYCNVLMESTTTPFALGGVEGARRPLPVMDGRAVVQRFASEDSTVG